MSRLSLVAVTALALWAAACPAMAQDMAPGTYTNEEQVYFESEAGRPSPPWTGVRIETAAEGLIWHRIDRFGTVMASEPVRIGKDSWTIGGCKLALTPQPEGGLHLDPSSAGCAGRVVPLALDQAGIALRLANGSETTLRRARPFTCWLTVKRDRPKPDGSEDWLFQAGMKTHDQGGRLRLGGGDSGAPEAIIRIRNVVWPPPTRNRPSLVLYVFTPDDMNRAVAYGWADPGAVRVGINQRWMQASCTLDGAE